MPQAPYQGRHRTADTPSATPSSLLPRIAGTGLLLPTVAAATLVLTATGAHFGSADPSLSTAAGVPAPGSPGSSPLVGRASGIPVAGEAMAALTGRASRDSQRVSITATDDDAATSASAGLAGRVTAPAAAVAAPAAAAAPAAVAAPPKPDAHRWVAPIDGGFALTSGFGMRWGTLHPGQDFAVPVGTPVKAMSAGTVILAGWSGGYGNKVEIQYWDGTISWYAHNSKLLVKQGDAVAPGQLVSLSGSTGHSTGPHLHLEIHPGGGDPVSPVPWLTAKHNMP